MSIVNACVKSLFISPVLDLNWRSDVIVKDRQHWFDPSCILLAHILDLLRLVHPNLSHAHDYYQTCMHGPPYG